MYQLLKPFLFAFKPEKIHGYSMSLLKSLGIARYFIRKKFVLKDDRLKTTVFGITFPNPVGLAAGFDKDAKYFKELSDLGFGFIEIGTVTPLPQGGNEKPRLFRLPEDHALINRMGFNNEGVDKAVERLKHKGNIIIGGNIGKNKSTPNELAINDYLICFEKLYPYVDYFVINLSSPNTPNLRELQDKEPLRKLLSKLIEARAAHKIKRPILLKIAPDLNNSQLDDIIAIAKETGLDGFVATNTTISREGLSIDISEKGGLSGVPLRKRATEVVRYLSRAGIPIIAVGGIHSAEDALEKLAAGACLVQLYTGFIYEGPSLVKKINRAILTLCSQNKSNQSSC